MTDNICLANSSLTEKKVFFHWNCQKFDAWQILFGRPAKCLQVLAVCYLKKCRNVTLCYSRQILWKDIAGIYWKAVLWIRDFIEPVPTCNMLCSTGEDIVPSHEYTLCQQPSNSSIFPCWGQTVLFLEQHVSYGFITTQWVWNKHTLIYIHYAIKYSILRNILVCLQWIYNISQYTAIFIWPLYLAVPASIFSILN